MEMHDKTFHSPGSWQILRHVHSYYKHIFPEAVWVDLFLNTSKPLIITDLSKQCEPIHKNHYLFHLKIIFLNILLFTWWQNLMHFPESSQSCSYLLTRHLKSFFSLSFLISHLLHVSHIFVGGCALYFLF